VKGDELYAHLGEFRSKGYADVRTLTVRDGKRTREDVERVRLDQRIALEGRVRPLLDYAHGCSDAPPDGKIEECYLAVYRKDRFVIHDKDDFDLGLAGKTTVALLGIVGYGVMANCAWNCDDEQLAGVSFIGLGVVGLVTIIYGIAKAAD